MRACFAMFHVLVLHYSITLGARGYLQNAHFDRNSGLLSPTLRDSMTYNDRNDQMAGDSLLKQAAF